MTLTYTPDGNPRSALDDSARAVIGAAEWISHERRRYGAVSIQKLDQLDAALAHHRRVAAAYLRSLPLDFDTSGAYAPSSKEENTPSSP